MSLARTRRRLLERVTNMVNSYVGHIYEYTIDLTKEGDYQDLVDSLDDIITEELNKLEK